MKVGDLVRLKYDWALEPDSQFRFGLIITKEIFFHAVPTGQDGWYIVKVLWENGYITREPENCLIVLQES